MIKTFIIIFSVVLNLNQIFLINTKLPLRFLAYQSSVLSSVMIVDNYKEKMVIDNSSFKDYFLSSANNQFKNIDRFLTLKFYLENNVSKKFSDKVTITLSSGYWHHYTFSVEIEETLI